MAEIKRGVRPKRGRKKSRRPPRALNRAEELALKDSRAWGRERVRQVSELERWSDHPGRAKIMVELRVYYPPKNCYIRVPGWNLKVILDPQELDNLQRSISWGVENWLEGRLTEKGFKCPNCGEGDKNE